MNFYQVFRIKQNGHNVVAKTKRNCTNSNIFKEITSKHKKSLNFSLLSLSISLSLNLSTLLSLYENYENYRSL